MTRFLAAVRYVGTDVFRSQRWIAPCLAFVAAVAIFASGGGPLLTTYADTCACLLPVAVWLTVVVVNAEDDVQAAATAVTTGGATRLSLAKLAVAYGACAVLTAVAVVTPLVVPGTSRITAPHVAAGVVGHLLVALVGVSIGSYLARPLVTRAGWSVVIASGACIAALLVPALPPTRPLLVLFDEHRPHLAPSLAILALETAALGTALTATALALARRRT